MNKEDSAMPDLLYFYLNPERSTIMKKRSYQIQGVDTMDRKITVKGTGQVSRKPDQVILDLMLESLDLSYQEAMNQAAVSVDQLKNTLKNAGFEPDQLKTTTFDVTTQYRSERDSRDNYIQIFEGYRISHGLQLEFVWEQERLTTVLSAVAQSRTNPHLDIRFSIKDRNAVIDEVLIQAAQNARSKALVLARASGVELGELIEIDYTWSDVHFYSNTTYMAKQEMLMDRAMAPSIEPQDISVSDSAEFIWEIKG